MTSRPLLLIVWEDAFNGNHSWFELESAPTDPEPVLVSTVGYELARTPERVTLVMSVADNGTACDAFTIPAGMIRSETTLTPPSPVA